MFLQQCFAIFHLSLSMGSDKAVLNPSLETCFQQVLLSLISAGVHSNVVWTEKLIEDTRTAWREKTFKGFHYFKEDINALYRFEGFFVRN